jgi:hypothetical protein
MLYVEEKRGKGGLRTDANRLHCAKIFLARKPQEAEMWLGLVAEHAEVLMPRSISRWKGRFLSNNTPAEENLILNT